MYDFCAGMHNAGLLEVRCLSRPWLVLVGSDLVLDDGGDVLEIRQGKDCKH